MEYYTLRSTLHAIFTGIRFYFASLRYLFAALAFVIDNARSHPSRIGMMMGRQWDAVPNSTYLVLCDDSDKDRAEEAADCPARVADAHSDRGKPRSNVQHVGAVTRGQKASHSHTDTHAGHGHPAALGVTRQHQKHSGGQRSYRQKQFRNP